MLTAIASTEAMSREDWLEWRKTGIGGSDASIICGINKYKSSLELWMEKTNKMAPKPSGEAAYWGSIMEPLIRDEFSKRTGLEVQTEQYIFQHLDHPFMLANLDGIIYDPEAKCHYVFEAKTASAYVAGDWDMNIPESYQLQVQHYMAVTDCPGAYVAVLIGGNQFKYYFIERDESIIELLIELERQFWDCVLHDIPPKIDGSQASSDLMNHLFPQGNTKEIFMLPDEAAELIEQYENASTELEQYTLMKDEAVNQLKHLMGDHEYGSVNNRTIAWTNVTSERFDAKALKADDPETHKKYLNASTYRRFTIK